MRPHLRCEICRKINLFLLACFIHIGPAHAHVSPEPSHSHLDAIVRADIAAGSAFFMALPLAALATITLRPIIPPRATLLLVLATSTGGVWLYLTWLQRAPETSWIAVTLCFLAWPAVIALTINEEWRARKPDTPSKDKIV